MYSLQFICLGFFLFSSAYLILDAWRKFMSIGHDLLLPEAERVDIAIARK